MKQRSVIITADGFGTWPEVNDAVIAGYDAGVITSASLHVNATASRSAMVSANLRSGLSVGLQLVLCDGKATLPRRHIPNLVNSDGEFIGPPLEAAWYYRKRGGLRDELKDEIRAQIERFMASGLVLSFICGHQHLHLHPTVVEILNELSSEYPIAAIRSPANVLVNYDGRMRSGEKYAWMETMALGWFLRRGARRAKAFVRPDAAGPLFADLPATESGALARVREVGSGVTELVCRPGSLRPGADGPGQAAVIDSPTMRKLCKDEGVDLISYQDLVESI